MPRLSILLALLATTACIKGGSEHRPKETAEAVPAREATATTPAGPSEDWLEGHLPATVNEGTPVRGGSVVVRAYYEPESINPLASSDGLAENIVMHHVSEALVRPRPYDDPDFTIEPELAERFEVSEDGRVQTFHLRHGVTWHDGKPFTSRDVLATFEKLRDPGVKSTVLRSLFDELETVTAPSDFEVVLTWKTPSFVALDAVSRLPIQPAHLIGDLSAVEYNSAEHNPMQRAPVGTGPFRFAGWETALRITLARNDAWWGGQATGAPWLDQVVYRIVPDHTAAEQLAHRHELDLWDAVQPHMWVDMKDPVFQRDFHRVRYHPASYVFIGWNARRPQLADAATRTGLSWLFPTRGLIEKLQHGLVEPTGCHFYYRSRDCDSELTPVLGADPARAKAALAAAGWKDTDGDGFLDRDGRPLHIALMIYPKSTISERIATLMEDRFTKAGIQVAIQKVEWSAMVRRLDEGNFDATALQWDTGPRHDPTPFWHSRAIEGGSNHFGFSNSRADALMDMARSELDPTRRHAMYRELGAILQKEQPVTFLYASAHLALVNRRVRGVRPSLYWWQPRDWWIVEPTGKKDGSKPLNPPPDQPPR